MTNEPAEFPHEAFSDEFDMFNDEQLGTFCQYADSLPDHFRDVPDDSFRSAVITCKHCGCRATIIVKSVGTYKWAPISHQLFDCPARILNKMKEIVES